MAAAWQRPIFIYEMPLGLAEETQILSAADLHKRVAGQQPQTQVQVQTQVQTHVQTQSTLIKLQSHKSDYNLN
jgi:hypothetical protein